ITAHSALSIAVSVLMKPMLADFAWARSDFAFTMTVDGRRIGRVHERHHPGQPVHRLDVRHVPELPAPPGRSTRRFSGSQVTPWTFNTFRSYGPRLAGLHGAARVRADPGLAPARAGRERRGDGERHRNACDGGFALADHMRRL